MRGAMMGGVWRVLGAGGITAVSKLADWAQNCVWILPCTRAHTVARQTFAISRANRRPKLRCKGRCNAAIDLHRAFGGRWFCSWCTLTQRCQAVAIQPRSNLGWHTYEAGSLLYSRHSRPVAHGALQYPQQSERPSHYVSHGLSAGGMWSDRSSSPDGHSLPMAHAWRMFPR